MFLASYGRFGPQGTQFKKNTPLLERPQEYIFMSIGTIVSLERILKNINFKPAIHKITIVDVLYIPQVVVQFH